jgi:hypothetical protein
MIYNRLKDSFLNWFSKLHNATILIASSISDLSFEHSNEVYNIMIKFPYLSAMEVGINDNNWEFLGINGNSIDLLIHIFFEKHTQ